MTCPFIDEATNKTIGKLLHCQELMRVYGREMPAKLTSLFLYVAANNGCYKKEIEVDLGLSSSTSTQTIQRLVDMNLLQKDYISRLMYLELTDDGEKLSHRLEMILR
jgi:DNA-binding MarR family transcriptional regulator|tara:strand:+ start:662 stop:982 length:321 start_codon:yes stop_codon:yes gene_type:complete